MIGHCMCLFIDSENVKAASWVRVSAVRKGGSLQKQLFQRCRARHSRRRRPRNGAVNQSVLQCRCGLFQAVGWLRPWLLFIATYNLMGGLAGLLYPTVLEHLFPGAMEGQCSMPHPHNPPMKCWCSRWRADVFQTPRVVGAYNRCPPLPHCI